MCIGITQRRLCQQSQCGGGVLDCDDIASGDVSLSDNILCSRRTGLIDIIMPVILSTTDSDEYATYYFLTHDAELDNLSRSAIDFEELEAVLQGIPARNKLFLMDTCGSGELDPGTAQRLAAGTEESKGVWSRLPPLGRGIVLREDRNDAQADFRQAVRAYLHDTNRYIYNDLVRRSGSIVFSSCRGEEVSYEHEKYENGLFTEYLIRALAGEADTDGNNIVDTYELRDFVRAGVSEETEADSSLYLVPQHPSVDRDNIYAEFGF